MNNLSGGYIMVDLSSPNKVKQLEKAVALNKPLLVYYQDGTTEWGKVTVSYVTVDDVEVPTYHITTANGFVTVEDDGDVSIRPLILEGNGVALEQEGVTIIYCKWSLSGTHLMIVCAGSVADTTIVADNTAFATYNIPEWILNKIVPIWANNIEGKTINFRAENWSEQNASCVLQKATTFLKIVKVNALTLTADRNFRIQFDLLIDNE